MLAAMGALPPDPPSPFLNACQAMPASTIFTSPMLSVGCGVKLVLM
jgi:hypothetical protein